MPFEVEQVVGSGSVQELICQTIHFHEHVEEIKEIRKTVIIDNCVVVFDKVIIDGRLRKGKHTTVDEHPPAFLIGGRGGVLLPLLRGERLQTASEVCRDRFPSSFSITPCTVPVRSEERRVRERV